MHLEVGSANNWETLRWLSYAATPILEMIRLYRYWPFQKSEQELLAIVSSYRTILSQFLGPPKSLTAMSFLNLSNPISRGMLRTQIWCTLRVMLTSTNSIRSPRVTKACSTSSNLYGRETRSSGRSLTRFCVLVRTIRRVLAFGAKFRVCLRLNNTWSVKQFSEQLPFRGQDGHKLFRSQDAANCEQRSRLIYWLLLPNHQ